MEALIFAENTKCAMRSLLAPRFDSSRNMKIDRCSGLTNLPPVIYENDSTLVMRYLNSRGGSLELIQRRNLLSQRRVSQPGVRKVAGLLGLSSNSL